MAVLGRGIVCFLLGLCFHPSTAAWQDNIKPKRFIHLGDDEIMSFAGNETVDDHFKVILPHSDFLLIGGRNIVYNISLLDFSVQNRMDWLPAKEQVMKCYRNGISNDLCQNYISILTKKSEHEYVMCGTNAFEPIIREFKLTNGNLEEVNSSTGRGKCPFDPSINTTAIYADGHLYVATISDFSGDFPFIYREPLWTTHNDLFALNQPNFVSSFALGDFVYFFFRETAVEYLNCGKTSYSRVARVCRHDKGGPLNFKNQWTSYLKSRLNCSISGHFPFYFNEIQATTDPIEGRYGGHATTLLYGVFTTPENSIPGSAICAFTFQDIMDTFEGAFKGKESVDTNWLPVKVTKVPEPRPGQCVKDSSTLPDVTINFIKTHSLMDEAVPAFFGQPLLMRTSYHSSGRFTAITVDPQVRTTDGKAYDILFIGTDDGKVVKAINTKSADSYQDVEPLIIEELVVFQPSVIVTSLRMVTVKQKKKLIVVSSSVIVSVSLHRCGTKKITTCSECVGLQDPYCGWDKFNRKCRVNIGGKELIQSIVDGVHTNCSKEKPSHSPSVDRDSNKDKNGVSLTNMNHPPHDDAKMGDDPSAPTSKSIPPHFTAETLAIAVASAAIGALILGFITGFFCGKKCNKEEENQLYTATDYEYYDQRQNANSRLTGDLQEEVTYAEPVLVPQSLNKPVNLLLNMSPKATLKTPASNTPAQNLPPLNTGMTLGGGGGGGGPPPLGGFTLAMPPTSGAPQGGGPQDIPLHYTPESYSTHGTLRSSEKFGTRGRDHKRDFDHRLHDGYSTTRSVKKVYL